MYDHTFKYKQVQISRSDIRPHIKWAVSLVILHMVRLKVGASEVGTL